MSKITIDFETRSRVDLKKCGAYVYAEDESTDVLCLSLKKAGEEPVVWVPQKFRSFLPQGYPVITDTELAGLMYDAKEIHAHNAQFERVIWSNVVCEYGFYDIPLERWRCTAAKAAAMALPRSLGQACEAMGLPQQKDKEGYKVMMMFCKPLGKNRKNAGGWYEDKADFLKLIEYCKQDVIAEECLSDAIPDLSDEELETWRMDQRINDRGVRVDLASIESVIAAVQEYENRLLNELQKITYGQIKSVRQRDVTLNWLKARGVPMADLTRNSVAAALEGDIDPQARRVLEIRQALGRSSVSKYEAMQRCAGKHDRVRGSLLYHGASTGRWAGRLIQPQNYPRGTLGEETEAGLFALCHCSVDDVLEDFGCPMETAASCLRSVMTAGYHNTFVCGDFSQIEARVLAWLAGESKVLASFIEGKDLYKVAASDIFAVDYDDVDKDQRQVGKTAELALGYQGGIGAFSSFAAIYGVDLSAMIEPVMARASAASIEQARNTAQGYFANLKKMKVEPEITMEQAIASDLVKQAWRENRQHIVSFWAGLEVAAVRAVLEGGAFSCGRIKYGIRGRFLHCRLPSGRLLSYCDPELQVIETPWGQEKEVVTFKGMDSFTNKWRRQKTYGGKLCENVVQAIARDLLVHGMLVAEREGFDIVLSVHDEAVAEVPEGSDLLDDFLCCLSSTPAWADGCPVTADGWTGKRYRKD